VPDHVLRHVDRDELLSVVHRDRVADHVRDDRRPARPGLEDLLLEPAIHLLDPLAERRVDERPLLYASGHGLFPVADDVLVGPLVVAGFLLTHAPRRARVPSARRLSLATAERMVDRVHGDAADRGPDAQPAAPA